MKTPKEIEKLAEEYANSIIPNPNHYLVPYLTSEDRWEEIKESFIAGCESLTKEEEKK
jgi:hypothetical protein